MPESLIIKLPNPAEGKLTSSRDAEILLDMDGARHKLTRVRRACIVVDSDEPLIQVDLTMYSPQFDEEIIITRAHAEAIRNHQTDQGLAFLTSEDRKRIRELREGMQAAAERAASGEDPKAVASMVAMWSGSSGHFVTLDKLIAELDRHERELAESPF